MSKLPDSTGGVFVRVRASSNRKKALAQYEELKRAGQVAGAVIIAELKDGSIQVLGQGFDLEGIARALHAAARGVTHAAETLAQPTLPAVPEPPLPDRAPSTGRRREPEIRRQPDGALVAPEGEHFVACGECGRSEWYVLDDGEGVPARFACTNCGNEVVTIRTLHGEGRA